MPMQLLSGWGGAFFGDNWTEEGRMRADMSLYEVVGDEGVAL